jgi:hypothetical protein
MALLGEEESRSCGDIYAVIGMVSHSVYKPSQPQGKEGAPLSSGYFVLCGRL